MLVKNKLNSGLNVSLSIVGIEKAARLLFGFYLNILIANLLGLQAFGIYSAFLALIIFCLTLSFIGIDNRLLTKRLENISNKDITAYRFLRSLLCCCIATVIFLSTAVEYINVTIILVLCILAGFVNNEQLAVIRADYKQFIIARLCTYLGVVIPLRIYGIYASASLDFFVWVSLVDVILPSMIYQFYSLQASGKHFFNQEFINFSTIVRSFSLLRLDIKYFAIGVLSLLSFRLDYILGIHFVSAEQLGQYAYGMMFVTPFTSLGKPLSYIVRSFSQGRGISLFYVLLFFGVIPLFVIIFMAILAVYFSDVIIEFLPYWKPEMLLLMLLIPLAWMALYSGQQHTMNENLKLLFFKASLSLILCVFFYTIVSVDQFGFLYLGLGCGIYYLVQGSIYDLFFQRNAYIE